jgi:pyrroloquinoline quinone biosynthesis protein B
MPLKKIFSIFICCSFFHFSFSQEAFIQILGVAQDGGYPHMGCTKMCCNRSWANDSIKKYVVSLALVNPATGQWWLFEATPDIKYQLQEFSQSTHGKYSYLPAGIFLTHAHMGHYTGLAQLGREVMNTKAVPVYVLPKFKNFLETNGPWSQLVKLENIVIKPVWEDSLLSLPGKIQVITFRVPHRDEYSETAGFKIITPGKKYLFIPDIDKWQKWDRNIVEEVKKVDVALLDATFYDNTELPGRKMEEVPHPLVSETMNLFKNENRETKEKLFFIHFNHTNPLMWDKDAQSEFKKTGFKLAEQGSLY